LIWTCVNIVLFIEHSIVWNRRVNKIIEQHKNDPLWKDYTAIYFTIAKGFAQLLNLNCALLLLPVMRTMLNVLRTLKFEKIIPLDKNIVAHRYLAYFIAICTAGHALAHFMNTSCCYRLYTDVNGNEGRNSWRATWVNKFTLTGQIIVITMILMYAAASVSYRRSKNFTIFWYVHHLFLIFYAVLLVHAKYFYLWFMVPAGLYILERFLRNFRGSTITVVKTVSVLPSNVVKLELSKPGFVYKSGQYCFLNCPVISSHEWHPFTISSAPEEEFLTFHIKVAGDWTVALKNLFVPSGKGTVVINKPTTPSGNEYLIRVDGPFGTAAEYVFDYEHVMLIAAGIGVTPYASLLKHMRYRLRQGRSMKIKRVYFYWINRDKGSWEWFSDLLDELEEENPDFFEIHTHMTGELKAEEVRYIVESSAEYTRNPNRPMLSSNKATVRAIYDYEPQDTDELEFSKGDEITVMERYDNGWWVGTNLTTGKTGLFPSNYTEFVDIVTKMKQGKNRRYGRPNWKEEFAEVRKHIENTQHLSQLKKRPKVGIFVCGPSILSKQLYRFCVEETKNSTVRFKFHKENF
jgi:predicted ferric reductase